MTGENLEVVRIRLNDGTVVETNLYCAALLRRADGSKPIGVVVKSADGRWFETTIDGRRVA